MRVFDVDDDDEVTCIALRIHPEGCSLRLSNYQLQPLAHGHYSLLGCMLGMYLYPALITHLPLVSGEEYEVLH